MIADWNFSYFMQHDLKIPVNKNEYHIVNPIA